MASRMSRFTSYSDDSTLNALSFQWVIKGKQLWVWLVSGYKKNLDLHNKIKYRGPEIIKLF
jgi:hypothetical protein